MPLYPISSALLSLTFLLPWTGEVVSGWSAFNQICTPYQDQYNSCDPFAYLTCEKSRINDYVCKCSSPEYVWSSRVGRCTLRVGSSCYVGPLRGGTNNNPDCPPSSQCDMRGSFTCKCQTDHVPNADGSACNKAVSFKPWLLSFSTLLPLFILGLDKLKS